MKRTLCSILVLGCCIGCRSTGSGGIPSGLPSDGDAGTGSGADLPPNQATGAQVIGSKICLSGQPIRLILDTAWQIVERCDDVPGYLDARKKQGFTGIILGSDGDWYAGDVSRPRAERMAKCIAVLDELEKRSMYAVLTAQVASFRKASLAIPSGQVEAYGKDFAKRFAGHKAVVGFLVGGLDELSAGFSPAIPDGIAKGIRSAAPTIPIMYHPKAKETSTDRLPLSDHCDVVTYQSYHISDYSTIMAAHKRSVQPGRPWCLIEGPFEGDTGVSADDVGRAAITAAKVGPCLMAYGHIDVALFSPTWRNRMSTAGTKSFLAACSYYK